jgi:hypothetical protein
MYPKDGNTEIGVFNREPSVVSMVNRLFDSMWDRAVPFGGQVANEATNADGLTADQRYAARLLMTGKTVESIAAEMGQSKRTANRLLQGLREAFGARSPAEFAWILRGRYPDGLPPEW